MSAEHDATEFVDDDFQPSQHAAPAAPAWDAGSPAPTREEVDAQVTEAQQKLAELKRKQEELERERASLEDIRRRQSEFETGREEMLHNLTRGLGLLEEFEVNARRDAELSAKTLTDFKEALAKLEAIDEGTWTKDNFSIELTRALTAIENARMEWNSARVRLPILSGETDTRIVEKGGATSPFAGMSFWQRTKLGFAFTWPFLLITLIILGAILARLARR